MDLRRVPAADLDVPSDPVLLGAIRSEIAARGPMTFARFMEIALYDPERGYYRGTAARPGRGGDFLTAPEAHPIFGRAVARFVVDVWHRLDRPSRFTIREHGAGDGALAEALLAGLDADGSGALGAIRYRAVEVEPARAAAVAARLDGAGRTGILEPDDGAPIDGPRRRQRGPRRLADASGRGPGRRSFERSSSASDGDGGLVDDRGGREHAAPRPPTRRRGVVLADGSTRRSASRSTPGSPVWPRGWAAASLLLIDYGHPAAELYDPARRAAGTLAAYLRHQVHDDPYRAIGRQDLTAHVDVSAVERAATAAGLVHLGTTTQAAFLDRLGAGEILVGYQSGPTATLRST